MSMYELRSSNKSLWFKDTQQCILGIKFICKKTEQIFFDIRVYHPYKGSSRSAIIWASLPINNPPYENDRYHPKGLYKGYTNQHARGVGKATATGGGYCKSSAAIVYAMNDAGLYTNLNSGSSVIAVIEELKALLQEFKIFEDQYIIVRFEG